MHFAITANHRLRAVSFLHFLFRLPKSYRADNNIHIGYRTAVIGI